MKRALLSLLLASIVLTISTLSGMAIFGMHHEMGTKIDSCGFLPCVTETIPLASSEADCLSHCLSTASSSTTAVAPLPHLFALLAVAFVVHIYSTSIAALSPYRPPYFRLREHIGKLLRHRHLSTVILRD